MDNNRPHSATTPAPTGSPDENQSELAELDAFLSDFVRSDIEQQAEATAPGSAYRQQAQEEEDALFDLPVEGVDISALEVDDTPETVNATKEDALMASRMQHDSATPGGGKDMFDDTFSAPPAARDAAGRPVPIGTGSAPRPLDKILQFSGMGVALAALVLALVAVWFALGVHEQLTDLRAELAILQQRPAPAAADSVMLEQLGHQVQEMQVLLEENKARLDESAPQLTSLGEQLTALEQKIASRQNGARAAPATAKTASKPQAAPAKPAPKQAPAPTPSSRAGTGGAWVVNVVSLSDAKMANAEMERLRQGGFNVEVQKAVMDGRTWYRVRATGFASREEAQIYGDKIRHKYGLSPWVGQEK